MRRNLEQAVTKLSEDVLALQQRAQDAEQAQKDMAEEHASAMLDMQNATAEGRKACTELANAHEQASKADSASQRAQQVLTRPQALFCSLAEDHICEAGPGHSEQGHDCRR